MTKALHSTGPHLASLWLQLHWSYSETEHGYTFHSLTTVCIQNLVQCKVGCSSWENQRQICLALEKLISNAGKIIALIPH